MSKPGNLPYPGLYDVQYQWQSGEHPKDIFKPKTPPPRPKPEEKKPKSNANIKVQVFQDGTYRLEDEVTNSMSNLKMPSAYHDPTLPEGAAYIATGDHHPYQPFGNKVVKMRRTDAYSKFLAFEGCLEVFMGNPGAPELKHFVPGCCIAVKQAFQLEPLLLKPILTMAHADGAYGYNMSVDSVSEIVWDDTEWGRPLLPAPPEKKEEEKKKPGPPLSGELVQVSADKVVLPVAGWLQKFAGKNKDIYEGMIISLKVSDGKTAPTRCVLGADGLAHPLGGPLEVFEAQKGADVVVELTNSGGLLGEGKISVASFFPGSATDNGSPKSVANSEHSSYLSSCNMPRPSAAGALSDPVVYVALTIPKTNKCGRLQLSFKKGKKDPPKEEEKAEEEKKEDQYYPYHYNWPQPEEEAPTRGHLKVTNLHAYDQLLAAALRACACDEHNLEIKGHWAWLLDQWAQLYGVRKYYQLLAHLRWVLKIPIASATAHCFSVVARELEPLLIAEVNGALTQSEAALLSRIKQDCEDLLRLAFENYYALRNDAPKGVAEGLSIVFDRTMEFPPLALRPALHLFHLLRDVFLPSDIEWLSDRFAVAAHKRWLRLAAMTDDSLVRESFDAPDAALRSHQLAYTLNHSTNPAYYAYKKLECVCAIIRKELEFDLALQTQPDLLPTSICLPRITAAEYCTNFVMWLRAVIAQFPPNHRSEPAIDLLVAVAQLHRFVFDTNIDMEPTHPGHIDVMELFGPWIREWITHSQEMLIKLCHQLEKTTKYDPKVLDLWVNGPIEGPNGADVCGVSLLVEEMISGITAEVHAYERVVKFWPVFGPLLEAAVCVVIRNVVVGLCRQMNMDQIDPKGGLRNGKGGPQFVWTQIPGGNAFQLPHGLPLATMLVRESILMNSLKRLMVVVPQLEQTMASWCGGAAVAPPGPPQPLTHANCMGYDVDDVAPYIGAQFAQVVKEMRTEYAAAVALCSERISKSISCHQQTNLTAIITTAKPSTHTPSTHMQTGVLEHIMQALLMSLDACLRNLKTVLDPRVFVAVSRGLWDFQGRELFEFVIGLQEGDKENRGAWKTRQNAKIVTEMLNGFFKKALLTCLERGGHLQDRDLEPPIHPEKTMALLAQSTSLMNNTFSPF